MTISYESIASTTNDNSATVTVNKPSGLAEDDLMLAFIGSGADSTGDSSATGWTLINGDDDSTFWGANPGNLTCLAKIADSSDVAASNFTFTKGAGNDECQAAILRFSATGDFDINTLIVSSLDNNSLTPANTNTMLVRCVFEDNLSSYSGWSIATDDPTWTEVLDNQFNSALDNTIGIAYANRPEGTATGAWSVTNSGGGELLRVNVAINESESVTVNGAVGSISLTGNAGSVIGTAEVSGSVGILNMNGQDGTVETQNSLVKNRNKNNGTNITNRSKS